MTLVQLKRHMDRRFDRLQRTKADKSDLKRFATKGQIRRLRKDLARFATKDDLKRFATKKDLQRHPTKDDLQRELERYSTRDDLAQLATKQDMRFAEVNQRFDSLDDKIDGVLRALLQRFDQQGEIQRRMYVEHDNRLKDLEQRVGL